MNNTTYYFPERQYRSSQGRWLSPDPAGLSAVNASNPQSWNRYAYVLNNPLRYSDPLGLYCYYGDTNGEAEQRNGNPDDYDFNSSTGECADTGGVWRQDYTTVTVNGDNPGDVGTTFENGQQIFPLICPSSTGGNNARVGNRYWTSWGDPNNPAWQRMKMLGTGIGNLAVGSGKLGGAAALEVGSGGVATALAIYGGWSASGNFAAGSLQVLGAFMPDPQPFNQGAQVAASATTITGLTTLVATGGNLDAASQAARWEGIFMSGFKIGATGNPPSLAQGYSGVLTTVNSVGGGGAGCN
jgi:RHS repeat-associated protein